MHGATSQGVDRYLARIGYDGDRRPGVELLAAVVAAHTETIAFETLGPFCGEPVLLGGDELQAKLVARRRGGFCFEHNLLLADVLEALGFATTGLCARVVWNLPPGVASPRAHMLVKVDLPEGTYLVDCGFGGMTLTGVLRLEVGVAQATPLEPFRLVELGDELLLEAEVGGGWKGLYHFALEPQQRIDFEVASWYMSTHPESIMVQHLLAARPTADRRYSLRDNVRTVHHLDGASERRVLDDPRQIEACLEEDFLLDLSGIAGLRPALARIC